MPRFQFWLLHGRGWYIYFFHPYFCIPHSHYNCKDYCLRSHYKCNFSRRNVNAALMVGNCQRGKMSGRQNSGGYSQGGAIFPLPPHRPPPFSKMDPTLKSIFPIFQTILRKKYIFSKTYNFFLDLKNYKKKKNLENLVKT